MTTKWYGFSPSGFVVDATDTRHGLRWALFHENAPGRELAVIHDPGIAQLITDLLTRAKHEHEAMLTGGGTVGVAQTSRIDEVKHELRNPTNMMGAEPTTAAIAGLGYALNSIAKSLAVIVDLMREDARK